MFRNLLNQGGGGGRRLFGGRDESSGDKPPSLPEHLQMSIDIASSMQSLVSMLVAEEEPGSKIQEEMEPLHTELVNLLKGCIEVNKENDKRRSQELDSSKFVMEQVQSQLIAAKKEVTETTMKLQKTKEELQESKQELKETKKELKEAQDAVAEASSSQDPAPSPGQQRPSLAAATESVDAQLMQSQVESLQHKLEHRQSRIDNLQHILSMKDREHETELTRQKAKAMLGGAPASENEHIQHLEAELDETREELEQVRDELEQQTEIMIEAEDKLKEADQVMQNKNQMEEQLEHLSELLNDKTLEVNEIENELEQMHAMMEQTKNIMNEQSLEIEEKDMQLAALNGTQQQDIKPAVDEDAIASLKEELEQTMIQLEDREDDIKKLKDDLQNTKEIMDIQAQVLQEHKNNPPPPPPQSQSFDSEEDVLGKISIEEHIETVQELTQQLQDARDKIADQSHQINEQHHELHDLAAAPWREENKDEPNLEEMKQELDLATKRNERLENQIEEIEDQLEEAAREAEQLAASIQSKDEQIRSFKKAEEELIAEMEHIRDEGKSTNSSQANEVEDKERIIESLEMQLLEADEAIQELQKEHVFQRKSIATTNDTAREEREAFIESLEMQLEDADTTIRKLETRVREKDKELKRLEADLESTRQFVEEAQQANEDNSSNGVDPKQIEEKDAEIERLEKKLKDMQGKPNRSRGLDLEVEEKDAEIERLGKKLKDAQEKAKRSLGLDEEIDEKDAEIEILEMKLKEAQEKVNHSRGLDEEIEEKDAEIARLEKKLKNIQERASRLSGSDEEIEEKDAEIARLEKKLKDVQERAMSEAEFAEVQKALLHANKSMKKGQKQITKLTEQLEGTEKTMARELAKAQELIDEKDATIRSLELNVEGTEASLAMSQEELQAQTIELKKMKEAIQGREHESRDGSDDSEATIKGLREEVASSKREASELREELAKKPAEGESTGGASKSSFQVGLQMDKLKASLLEKEKLAKKQQEKIEEMNDTIKSLRGDSKPAQNEGTKKRVSAFGESTETMTYQELKDRVDILEKQQAESATEVAKKELALNALQKELDSAKEGAQNTVSPARADKSQGAGIESLEKEIGLHEKDVMIASLEKELQALTASDKQTKQGGTESDGTVSQLQADLKAREQTINTLQSKLKELPPGDPRGMAEELLRAQNTISSLHQEIGDLEGNMKQALSALIKDKDSEIKRLGIEFDSATKVVVEKEAEIARLKEQLEENERTMTVVIRSRKDQADDLEKMKGRFSALECELEQAKKDEEATIQELNNNIQILTDQLAESEESIRTLQRKGQQTKRKSVKDKDDTKAEIETLKTKIKTLQAEVNKKNQDKIRIKELESQLEREVEQSIEVGLKKQSEIDVLTADLQTANTRIEDLGDVVRGEREKRERKVSKNEHRIIDLADRLEQEVDHSESLQKQLDTYKHSLKAKRKIIDSQAHELRHCQDKLDMHDSITRKAKRKMKQLENEIWNLEGELESINMYLRGQQRGGFGGGRDPRGMQSPNMDPRVMQGPYADDVPVNQYLDHFSKKVLSARRQLEAAQDKMYRGR
ncbi:MAG: hypothetical protein SGBAC_002421 [Bacillariaceae sp.]